ncbi:hypothetical protein BHM03_00015940, partial [Ensete ventricosum]
AIASSKALIYTPNRQIDRKERSAKFRDGPRRIGARGRRAAEQHATVAAVHLLPSAAELPEPRRGWSDWDGERSERRGGRAGQRERSGAAGSHASGRDGEWHHREVCFPGDVLIPSKNTTDTQLVIHSSLLKYVFFYVCSAANWKYAAKQFVKSHPEGVVVHRELFDCSECNYSTLTFDGVDVMGERLADEVSAPFLNLGFFLNLQSFVCAA